MDRSEGMVTEMATVLSLLAYRNGLTKMGLDKKGALRLAANTAKEMIEDGDMVADPRAPVNQIEVEVAPSRQTHPDVSDHGGQYGYYVGEKYERLDIAEIAKRLRAEIKEKIAKGELPKGLKVSVTIERYSGGQSMTMKVVRSPQATQDAASIVARALTPHVHLDLPYYTEFGSKLLKDLEAMANAYRYDRSDSQTDYFDTNFYVHAKFDSDLEGAERQAALATMEKQA